MQVIVEWDTSNDDDPSLAWAHDLGWHKDFPQNDCNVCNAPDSKQFIPDWVPNEHIADYLSDKTGFLVITFRRS